MGSSKSQTIGYRYHLGLHLVFIHARADLIKRVQFDRDRTAWRGSVSSGSFTINAEGLFGGDQKEGGVSGTVDFESGSLTQGRNAYLQSQLGTDIPAFRGVTALVLHGLTASKSFYCGMNPYLKIVNARLQRIHYAADDAVQWYDAKAAIPGPDLTVIPTGSPLELTWAQTTTEQGTNDEAGLGVAYFDALAVQIGATEWSPIIATDTAGSVQPADPYHWTARSFSSVTPAGAAYLRILIKMVRHSGPENNGTIDDIQATLNGVPLSLTNPDAETGDASGWTTTVGALSVRSLYGAYEGTYYFWGGPHAFTDAYQEVVQISDHLDMNPSHILRECLTDRDWGMGYNTADVDDTTFTAAADTLYTERMGISLLWDKQMPIEDFIKEILRHINAALFVSRSTGKFILKLIRNDYDEGTLPTLDADIVESVDGFSYPAFGELVNSVTVNYWDSATNTVASLTEQDTALIQMQGATINTTLQYPGFTNRIIASRVALRDLQTLSSPLRSATIIANTEAATLNIGDPFILDWPDFSAVTLVFRVIGMTLGDGKTNKVKITAVQDQFALPAVTSVPDAGSGGGWTDPSQPPAAATSRVVIEAPYYELVQREGQTAVDAALETEPAAGYLLAAAVRPGSATNAQVHVDAGAGYEAITTLDFSPLATLSADVSKTDTVWSITEGTDFDLVVLGTHAQINNEFVEVVAKTTTTLTVARAVLDSVPGVHLTGDKIVFWDETGEVAQVQYVDGESLDVKILPSTGQGTLAIADATADTVVMDARAIRPYPPGQFKVDASYYPTTVAPAAAFTVTWVHRDRLLQADQLVDFLDAGVGPEPTTRYGLRFLRTDTQALLVEKLDIDALTADVILFYTGDVDVELFSVTDNGQSRYSHTHTFAYTMPVGTLASSITAATYVPGDHGTIFDGGVVGP